MAWRYVCNLINVPKEKLSLEGFQWTFKQPNSPAFRLFVQKCVQADFNLNVKELHYVHYVKGIHRPPVDSHHKGLMMWKVFPCQWVMLTQSTEHNAVTFNKKRLVQMSAAPGAPGSQLQIFWISRLHLLANIDITWHFNSIYYKVDAKCHGHVAGQNMLASNQLDSRNYCKCYQNKFDLISVVLNQF